MTWFPGARPKFIFLADFTAQNFNIRVCKFGIHTLPIFRNFRRTIPMLGGLSLAPLAQPGVFGKPTGDVAKCTEYFFKKIVE